MRGIRIIPLLVVLLFLVYLGVLFVEANQEQVIITLGTYETNPTRLGFVIMTSTLIGIFVGAALASAQVFILFLQNRSLKKRIVRTDTTLPAETNETSSSPGDGFSA